VAPCSLEPLRIICLVTGHVRAKAGERGVRRYVVDEWRDEAMPVNAFLIEHPDGVVLFDTGQTARAAAWGWFPRWHPFFRLSRFELAADDEIASRLRVSGAEPQNVRTVVLSHLHTDHVGGVDAFPHARVIVHRLEWEQATGVGGRLRGYLPQRWPDGVEPTLVDLDGAAVGPFRASYDVAGDGRLLLVPTPGHTAGHASLLVRDERQSWLLAGDLAHTGAEVARVAPEIADWCDAQSIQILTAHDAATPAEPWSPLFMLQIRTTEKKGRF
jgi:N-acyl homoserine lactone hydrolase